VAEAKIALEAARLMTRQAAASYDAGLMPANTATWLSFLSADAAIRCLDQAIEVHGGAGFTREVALANMYEFVRLFKTVPISREMILNHVAQHKPRAASIVLTRRPVSAVVLAAQLRAAATVGLLNGNGRRLQRATAVRGPMRRDALALSNRLCVRG